MFVTRVFFDAARSSAASPSASSLFFHSGPHSFVSSSRDSSPNDISLSSSRRRVRAFQLTISYVLTTHERAKKERKDTHTTTQIMRNNAKKREKKESAETKRHTFKKRNDVLKRRREPEERIFERTQQKRRQATGDDYNIYCMLYFSLLL